MEGLPEVTGCRSEEMGEKNFNAEPVEKQGPMRAVCLARLGTARGRAGVG